ncbi:hypothetical protein ACFX12_039865 [Malus domestica]
MVGGGGIYCGKQIRIVNDIKGRPPTLRFGENRQHPSPAGSNRYSALNFLFVIGFLFTQRGTLQKQDLFVEHECTQHHSVQIESTKYKITRSTRKKQGARGRRKHMANPEVKELVVHLEKSMDLTTMERGVKLVGAALTSKSLNKWGVRNILRSSWKDMGEVEVKWVQDNTFIIIVQDESTAVQILRQSPWAVMKQNFSVKRWPPDLALEEVQMALVHFWVQLRGVPFSLSTETNVRRLAKEIGDLVELDDPAKTRGFLRVRVEVNTKNHLARGCWIPRGNNTDSWIEFRYERLQDFCYRCGRIWHVNNECSFAIGNDAGAGYGEWMKSSPVRDAVEIARPLAINTGERRLAGAIRGGDRTLLQQRVEITETPSRLEAVGTSMGPAHHTKTHSSSKGMKRWNRGKSRTEGPQTNFQQWVVDLGQLGPQPTHSFPLPSPSKFPQAARIQEIIVSDGPCFFDPGRNASMQLSIPNMVYTVVNEVNRNKRGSKREFMEIEPYSHKKTKQAGDILLQRTSGLETGQSSSVVDESQAVPLNLQERLEDASKQEEIVLLVGMNGEGSQGGGGWLLTAAEVP